MRYSSSLNTISNMWPSKIFLSVLILTLDIEFFECKCIKSFMTICDSIDDLLVEPPSRKSVWKELLIQGDKYEDMPQHVLTRAHLTNMASLRRLIVSKQLKHVEKLGNIDRALREIRSLILCDNNLGVLKNNTFTTSKYLEEVSLHNNRLKSLEPNFLQGRYHIDTLDLSKNRLRTLQRRLFQNGGTVSKLDARKNRLVKLGKNSLPLKLKTLHLDHNDIHFVSRLNLIYQNLTQLKTLTLSHNKLIHLADLPLLKSLLVLDISHNNIQILGRSLDNLKNVRLWNFEGNFLTRFTLPSFLKGNSTETYVFLLAFNRLRNVKLAPPYGNPVLFTLRGNPWNCRCFQDMERAIAEHSDVDVVGCDMALIREAAAPFCVVGDSVGEECSDEQIPEERFDLFKKMQPEDDGCNIDLSMARF